VGRLEQNGRLPTLLEFRDIISIRLGKIMIKVGIVGGTGYTGVE
jgi:hypothetical protein